MGQVWKMSSDCFVPRTETDDRAGSSADHKERVKSYMDYYQNATLATLKIDNCGLGYYLLRCGH